MLADCIGRSNPFFKLFCGARTFLSATLLVFCTSAVEPTFLGKDSCASSSCHGGGGANQNQNIVWSRQDPHSRAPATLTTARSKRLAQLLKISDPTRDHRCTSCHQPWQNLPTSALPANTTSLAEAVSCETCHGPARNYLRSHTRTDLARAEKLADGLRDLTILYNRANNCVACHQRVDSALLEVGHPELLFEMDGQTASMPRHWRERETNTHAAAWLTGQATALRELTAQIRNESRGSDRVFVQWQSVLWVINAALPNGPISNFDTNTVASAEKLQQLHAAADKLALEGSSLTTGRERTLLENVAKIEAGFASAPLGSMIYAARAERLVVAIDRLLYGLPKDRPATLQERSDELFRLVQSRPDFSPERFASALKNFRNAIPR
jgi:hypothetical protein